MGKFLIVDDEKSIRFTLSEFLKKEGHQTAEAADALIACQMIIDNDYDVIVTDIIMPRVSGIELLSFIRKKSATIQVIIMTGEPTVETAINAMHTGANAYLKKPVCKDEFLKTVHHALEVKLLIDEKAALALDNQRYQKGLEEIVERRTEDLQKAMQSIISLLTNVVEIKDPYTAGHQRHVGNLSAAIAHKMKFSSNQIEMIRIIGYLHDIGKIMVPSELLSKPGKINQLEMALIRNHPYLGYEMIKKVKLPDIIGDTIYQHHERCDGSGYPRGLCQDQITMEAQIIMVADVMEAILSHRPYRPALGINTAFDELKCGAGKLYNPEVVEACLDLFENDHYSIDDYEYKVYFPINDDSSFINIDK